MDLELTQMHSQGGNHQSACKESLTGTVLSNGPHPTRSDDSSGESFFKKSEFLDPIVRINKMKFLTSSDIRVASNVKYTCLDLRLKKSPKLSEIFKQPGRTSGYSSSTHRRGMSTGMFTDHNDSNMSNSILESNHKVMVAELDLSKG